MTDDDFDRSQTWAPPPPDDDDYEDPNPRALTGTERTAAPVAIIPVDHRKASEREASTHVAEAIKLVGVPGMLGELLDQMAREPVEVPSECSKCKHVLAPFYRTCPKCEGDRNRRRVDRVAELVRELKDLALQGDASPEREREIRHELREFDHPDVDGLERWCSAARDKAERAGSKQTQTRKGYADRW